MLYCSYYQAHVLKSKTWMLVAVLRSFEHLCFDRTLDKQEGVFEFFVPQDLEPYFLEVMDYFKQENIVTRLKRLPNRLADSDQAL